MYLWADGIHRIEDPPSASAVGRCGDRTTASTMLRSWTYEGIGMTGRARIGGSLRVVLLAALVTGWLGMDLMHPSAGRAAPVHAPPAIGTCSIFPANNVWNTRIDTLPVHELSDAWIASIGPSTGLKADFGSGIYGGSPIGIPYTTAPGSQPEVEISFDYPEESDPGPYRLPFDAHVEGGGDGHVLVIDRDRCLLTEIFDVTKHS